MSVTILPARCGEHCHDKPHILRDVAVICTLKPGHADWHYDAVANHRWSLDGYDALDVSPA